jgi:hypothetical protein
MQPEQIAAGLLDASLPESAWTHRGHITAAHVLVSEHGPKATLTLCRERIPLLNDAHGVENSQTGGYHETLTVFYVAAVADAVQRGLTIDETVAELDRDALRRGRRITRPLAMAVLAGLGVPDGEGEGDGGDEDEDDAPS